MDVRARVRIAVGLLWTGEGFPFRDGPRWGGQLRGGYRTEIFEYFGVALSRLGDLVPHDLASRRGSGLALVHVQIISC